MAAVLFAPLVLLVHAGCSGGSSEPSSGGETLSEANFAETYAQEFCAHVSPCCQAELSSFDDDMCRTKARQGIQQHKSNLVDRGLPWVFDAGHAERCIAQLREAPADCSAVIVANECSLAYRGALETGEACTYPWDCKAWSGPYEEANAKCAYYSDPNGQPMDFCQLERHVRNEGEECEVNVGPPGLPPAIIEDCREGLICREGFWKCEAASGVGGPCPCGDDSLCDEATSTCVPLRKSGEPCTADFECESSGCGTNGTCYSVAGVYVHGGWCGP